MRTLKTSLTAGAANQSPWAKSSPQAKNELYVFKWLKESFINIILWWENYIKFKFSVHKVLLEHSHIHFIPTLHGFFGTVTAELSSYYRPFGPETQPKYLLSSFLQKSWPTAALECQDSSTQMFSMNSLCCFSKDETRKLLQNRFCSEKDRVPL